VKEDVRLVIFAIQGWTEAGAWKNSLLGRLFETISGVRVVIPDYMDGTGKFAKFKSHLRIEQYAARVRAVYEQTEKTYPDVPILVVGHSLGGLIARYLCNEGSFLSKDMVLAGTPNKGIGGELGRFLPIVKILASRHVCNVPVLYQLLAGSKFLQVLNRKGIPRDAHYIRGLLDITVSAGSADPLNIGTVIECNHHMFPRREEEMDKVKKSAIPVIMGIVEERLKE
jgi:pimeloyl-ACP methyl ester carboxylesterase